MSLPFFFADNISGASRVTLDAETSRHMVQVLRMAVGERLLLTDGKGIIANVSISLADKHNCSVNILDTQFTELPAKRITIAVSMLKQPARFEWFLEKATEIGVFKIIPLICMRTEKQQFRADRWMNILRSAMLQSRRSWLPDLCLPMPLKEIISDYQATSKLIAHCEEDNQKVNPLAGNKGETLILIGPEGDFTAEEINLACINGYTPVSLGDNRLRTETAAMVAAVLLGR